jgi:hypothetical protein
MESRMEYFDITKTPAGFHIEGFPDALKVIRLDGPKARRLADLSLHKADLEFALECLTHINKVSDEPHVMRQALWRSAVVHFVKCFGGSDSRFSLDARVIYKSDPEGIEQYKYFESLRNKHLVHDENSYAQCLPGAILNKGDSPHKIERVVCLNIIGDTLSQGSYSNLHLLVAVALNWVTAQFDQLSDLVTEELEAVDYDLLFSREGIVYSKPEPDDVHKKRNAL